ncbi:MAG: hypothetical protein V7K40_31745 [Nostoc sp.]
MPTATKQITVQDLIQELQNLPQDAPVSFQDVEDLAYVIVGYEAGSDGVIITIGKDESEDGE